MLDLQEAEKGVPDDIKRELLDCALKNGQISYHWLLNLYKRGMRNPISHSDEYYLAMAALDNYPIDDGLPKSTSVVYRIHQLGHRIPKLDYVAILKEAKQIVNNSVLYRKFIDGTPLENDIAVWMADFAVKIAENK